MEHTFQYQLPSAQMPTTQQDNDQRLCIVPDVSGLFEHVGSTADIEIPQSLSQLQHPGPSINDWLSFANHPLTPNPTLEHLMSLPHTGYDTQGVAMPQSINPNSYSIATGAQMPGISHVTSVPPVSSDNTPSMSASPMTPVPRRITYSSMPPSSSIPVPQMSSAATIMSPPTYPSSHVNSSSRVVYPACAVSRGNPSSMTAASAIPVSYVDSPSYTTSHVNSPSRMVAPTIPISYDHSPSMVASPPYHTSHADSPSIMAAPTYPVSHTNTPPIVAASPIPISDITSPFTLPLSSSDAPREYDVDDIINWRTVTANYSHLVPGPSGHPPSHPHTPEPLESSVHATPVSPAASTFPTEGPSKSQEGMSPASGVGGVESTSPRSSLGDFSDPDQNGTVPYSRLIREALMSAERKMLPLQGIYQWFGKNTARGKSQNSKAWQNSIRHNLSMNAGFEAIKVEVPGKRPMNYWRLTDDAIRHGVKSTTRYRKMANRKVVKPGPTSPRRQQTGPKEGKTGAFVKRRAPQGQPHSPTSPGQTPLWPQPQPSMGLPQSFEGALPNPLPQVLRSDWRCFDLTSVVGTTGPQACENRVFCDAREAVPICPYPVGPWIGYS